MKLQGQQEKTQGREEANELLEGRTGRCEGKIKKTLFRQVE